MDRAVRGVGADQDELARQPVAEDAAGEKSCDLRERPGCEHEPELRGAAQVEHGERERDRHDVRAEEGDRAACEQEPEVAVTQSRHPHGGYASAVRLSRVRTSLTSSMPTTPAKITPAASQSVSSAPTAAASGPATMSPSGIRTNDPSASYE